MKKIIVLSLICTTIAVACSKKTVPATSTSNETKPVENTSPQTTTTTPVTTTTETKPGTSTDVAKPTVMDQGKTIFVTKCVKCHGLKNPGDYTTDRWNSILKEMIPKARLSSDEGSQVTTYLLANAKK